MEAIKLNAIDELVSGAPLPILAGTRTYLNRSVEYASLQLEECMQELRCSTLQGIGNASINSSIWKALNRESQLSEQYISCETERYYEALPSVWIDRFNMLEACGCMQATKSHTVMYSFHDKFVYMLAYLFRENPEIVKQHLLENCKKLNIDFNVLSYAFCTLDTELISTINLQCLVGVCDLLDLFIQDVFWYPDNCVYAVGGVILNIADGTFTPEERITTYLITSIAYIQQNILDQIINLFKRKKEPFVTSRYCMLCSKGFGNIVITAENVSKFKPLDITFNDSIAFKLEPTTYRDIGGINESSRYNWET